MPGLAPDAVAGILQRVMLQSGLGDADATPPGEQAFPVARHEVRESLAEPEMSVEPETAAHGVNHPVATIAELDPFGLQRHEVQWRRDRRDRRDRRTTRPSH